MSSCQASKGENRNGRLSRNYSEFRRPFCFSRAKLSRSKVRVLCKVGSEFMGN